MNWDLVGNGAMFAVVILAAVIYLAARARKENHEETYELAHVRGERIDDLEREMTLMKETQLKQTGQIELLLSQTFGELVNELRLEIHRLKEL